MAIALSAADLALFDADRAADRRADRSAFRAALKRHREARRWSQEWCAGECGVDHSLLSRIESGQRNITRAALAKLCAGLELPDGERDRLYLLAGYTPPDLDAETLAGLVEIARANDTDTLAAALHLIRTVRLSLTIADAARAA
jgi:transcriptional regulator with XRE-family HTH domain